MIDKTIITLPSGIRLSCRTSGTPGAPLLMFLHGFPEGAFVWDELLEHFGTRYRCIAPNLRGYELSSAPAEVEAYRAKHVMADIAALLDELGGGPLEALIAHDWGGAVAWNFAVQSAKRLKRLVIINSPHPGTFLRELQTNPAQQAASAATAAHTQEAHRSAEPLQRVAARWLAWAADAEAASPDEAGRGPGRRGRTPRLWRSHTRHDRVEAVTSPTKRLRRGRPSKAEASQGEGR